MFTTIERVHSFVHKLLNTREKRRDRVQQRYQEDVRQLARLKNSIETYFLEPTTKKKGALQHVIEENNNGVISLPHSLYVKLTTSFQIINIKERDSALKLYNDEIQVLIKKRMRCINKLRPSMLNVRFPITSALFSLSTVEFIVILFCVCLLYIPRL